jgi:4-amino-4-deoxy-L-arabinose transferase-like glycosyltransferase
MIFEAIASAVRPVDALDLTLQRSRVYVAVLSAVCIAVFFHALGDLQLWDVDEGMHAVTARNMVLTGDWITPVFNGEAFLDKPALFNWLGALSFSLLGFSEFSARLPAAMFGTATVMLTFLLGKMLYGRASGFFAGLVLATSLEFIIVSRLVVYDVPFTFFTTLSLYLFCAGVLSQSKRRALFLCFYASIALAVLTKGLLGIFLPALAIGTWLLAQRKFGFIRQMHIIPGVGVILLIAAPWFILMEQANPGYLHYFFMNQHLANLLGQAGDFRARHPEPVYYFVPVLLLGMFPWSFMILHAVRDAMRSRFAGAGALTPLIVIWLVSIFVFFSLASSKLSTYILPVFPAAALLLGRYLAISIAASADRAFRHLVPGLAITAVLIGGLSLYVVVFDPWAHWEHEAGLVWTRFEIFLLLLTAIAGLLLLLARMRLVVPLFVAACAVSPAIVEVVGSYLAPGMQAFKSSVAIGKTYDELLPAGAKMTFHGRMLDSALYYTGREADVLHGQGELRAFLLKDDVAYVLVSNYQRILRPCTTDCAYVYAVAGNNAIVTNRDPDDASLSRVSIGAK